MLHFWVVYVTIKIRVTKGAKMSKKNNEKVRLDNQLIDIFTNLPKSTNTAMSWLLLHKSMKESLNSKENKMKFNLLDFISEYQIEPSRKQNLKRDLIRDFDKLENVMRKEYFDENGHKNITKYYFFQKTNINTETLEVEVSLNEDIYNSVSSIPEKKYFQYLKQEAIMIANKKLTPNDIKLLMYLKSKTHNGKDSYCSISINEMYDILGKSSTMRFAHIKERYLDPFIERTLKNTNYRISYDVKKNKLNKRKIETILFYVDNRKEKVNIISKHLEKDTEYNDQIAQKHYDELEPQLDSMNKHEQKVITYVEKNNKEKVEKEINKNKQSLLEDLQEEESKIIMNNTLIMEDAVFDDANSFDFFEDDGENYE